MAATRKKK